MVQCALVLRHPKISTTLGWRLPSQRGPLRRSMGHLRCKQGQDTAPCPHVHDHLALEVAGILHDGCIVGPCPHIVLQHVLLVLQHAIVVEVQVCAAAVGFPLKLIEGLRPASVGGVVLHCQQDVTACMH